MTDINTAGPPEVHQVAELQLLSEDEAGQQAAWNATATDYPKQSCVHELIAAQASRTPNAVAVTFGEELLTYGELEQRANRVAHRLVASRASGTLVAICAERSLDLLVGMLGVLKAGAAYLPLDPRYPYDRLAFVLEDSGASLLLTQRQLLASLPPHGAEVIFLDDSFIDQPATDPAVPANSDDLAYVLYTSGSTGRPKGVCIHHRAVVNFLTSMARRPGMSAGDTIMAITTCAFDIATLELWLPLVTGARMVIAPWEVASDGRRLAELMARTSPTVMQATPTTWQMLIDSGWNGHPRLVALCGGEALPRRLADALLDRTTELWNMYGPTETTVWSTMAPVRSGDNITIGTPIANTTVYIVDRGLNPVPVGVAGELLIGGDGVARGYLNRPELTEERFLADPFSTQPGARLYRTGDLARHRADGNIEYLGRIDHQVKIRGHRVECGEVEAVLEEHTGVANAVVLAPEDTEGKGERSLVAYLVLAGGDAPGLGELRAHLGRRLPEYMMPSAFVVLEALPLTPNGKIDRRALPAAEAARLRAETEYVAPRTDVEERVAAIWARTLGLDRVGINDNFLDIGGHSLLAARLLIHVERELATRIPLGEMFAGGLTVADIATLIGAARVQQAANNTDPDTAAFPGVPSVAPRPHREPAPLSAAEAQLWFFTQLAPDNPVYNGAFVILKRGAFEVEAFRAAFNELVRRHEILRSTFEVIDDVPMQIVHPPAVLDLPLIDMRSLPAEQREHEADQLAAADACRPYHVERGPLVRARLTRLAEDTHRLDLAMPHLIYDEISLGILMSELASVYDAFSAGRASPLSDPIVQYADYATWEHEWTASDDFVNRLDYWRQRLDDAPALRLPLDHVRPTQQRFRGGAEQFSIPLGLAEQLRSISRESGSTLFQAMAAIFAILLHRYSGQEDVVFGTIADQRERPELQTMVGYCVTPVVIRGDVSGDPTFSDLLRRVRGELLDGMTHLVPFERLVRELQPPREAGANPYFQAVVVMQQGAAHPADAWTMQPLDDGAGAAFDLTMQLVEHPDGHLDGRLVYDTDLFEPTTARRMADHWMTLLHLIAAGSQTTVSELPMLSQEELHQQLIEWNSTEAEFPRDACVHELIADQVRRSPDAVAVSDGRGTLTFAQLDEQAGRLAAHLRGLGVGPDELVGICMQRSTDMVVALLGILKAGGAFMPLEPDQPSQRLALMLNEARPKVVLTTTEDRRVLPPTSGHIVIVDDERDSWMSRPPMVATDCGPENLAYVLFTSGSTGTPKGVMVEHRSLVNHLVWKSRALGLTPADRLLQKTPLGFDPALWELFCPLLTGASLTLLRPGDHADPRRLVEAVRDERITVVSFVPSMLAAFIATVGSGGYESLRLVTSGGETISRELVDSFFDRFGDDIELRNLYGPTEAVIAASSWRCGGASDTGSVPIGRPVANTTLYILDAHLQPAPIGAPGELCIGGVQVARGYLNQPGLTAERFVANPFRPAERIYRTGDMARYRNDGAIDFLGRRDGQVKIRGVRIELREIEMALDAHPGVADAVVLAPEDPEREGERRLVAYVVPSVEPSPGLAELRAHLLKRVPAYMVPSAFVMLEALPRTPSGKVDRRALPTQTTAQLESETAYVAPRTSTERRLAAIWIRMLRLGRVGVHDDFFELGGHSLLAVRLLSEMERGFGVEISLVSFFRDDVTVAGLAAAVEKAASDPTARGSMVGVHTGGDAPVIFFVYPDESSMLTLRHFTEPLGSDHRIVGLVPERNGRPFDRSLGVEDLAAPMFDSIRRVQPTGPYRLAGYSFGGLLAYELASRLRAEGEELAWLGLLDGAAPGAVRRIRQRRLRRLWRITRQTGRGPREALGLANMVARREFRALLVRLHVRPMQVRDWDWRGASKLAQKYRCSPNDAPLHVFATEETDPEKVSSLGWDTLHLGPLRVHHVPGDHKTMVQEPFVSILANELLHSLRSTEPQLDALPR